MKSELTKILDGTQYANVDPAILAEAVKNVTERLRAKTFGINRKKISVENVRLVKKGLFYFL
ncbi:hypothetical protein LEP1GSC170_1251 [Leptospira interrogans serovar Bataviae str. HAI135]|nr:hypothetical protein LEP1GSC170_1251 [Leptospira interrogans serovar Bataviae str. HAI135]